MESDEHLMRRLQGGDDDALTQLLQRYRRRLFGFLVRRVDPTSADDLFQETWIRVVRYRDRFDPTRRFSTWLFQIANNLCRDRARRRGSEGRMKQSVEQQALMTPPAMPTRGVDQRLDMQGRISALPDKLREVILLRYYHALSEAEIAEVAGIPRGTVKSRLHNAVKALRQHVAEEDA